jgi:hypothetical protein
LKKLTGSVRFYKPETKPKPEKNKKKTEPTGKSRVKLGKNQAKQEKIEQNCKNRAKPV